ncbi:hypothetical protein NBH20_23170 [Rhizobium sp. S153]|uniref:Uncharacterized protein n=1 Tax=Ciceribacter sichuanensis TaxID=2949647 RepID=A0ABT0VDV2_9HYPH|nr:hypothetical protein [Ciceribacter sp. S153]MCM2404085.1 hypothetical protein [Ciceribacter sp. S153]
MSIFIILFGLALLFGLTLLVLICMAALRPFWMLWKWIPSDRPVARAAVVAAAFSVLVALPLVLLQGYRNQFHEARVPDPLEMGKIEYQLEESWGIGGPGDNETGFVVYQLTEESAGWARAQGSALATQLSEGAKCWKPTPVEKDAGKSDDFDRWIGPIQEESEERAARKPNIDDYLDRYGFTIPVEKERMIEVDSAIQNPGSFYCYGSGGSLTIVDPVRGKVYFAYAG